MAAKIKQAKIAIRKEIKKKISSLYNAKKLQYESEWVADIIRKLPQYKAANSLTCFVSMDNREINTDKLLKYCFEDNKKVYLPKIIGDNKDEMIMLRTVNFEEIYDANKFAKSKWGIWEPNLTYTEHKEDIIENKNDDNNINKLLRENAMDTLDLDLMIIPGVGFNEKNIRLGHGKGHYDKYFTKYKQSLKNGTNNKFPYLIGIGLAANYYGNIPIENHDYRLDKVVLFKEQQTINDDNI